MEMDKNKIREDCILDATMPYSTQRNRLRELERTLFECCIWLSRSDVLRHEPIAQVMEQNSYEIIDSYIQWSKQYEKSEDILSNEWKEAEHIIATMLHALKRED